MSRSILRLTFLVTCLAMLSGCGGSKPSRFYMLSPAVDSRETGAQPVASDALVVGLYPIELAEYLKRPQIVRRVGSHQMEVAEFDLWAEPLEDNLGRALATNLGAHLEGSTWVEFPHTGREDVQFEVKVEILRLDVDGNGIITLGAHCELIETGVDNPVAQWTTNLTTSTQIEDPKDKAFYNDVVSGMSDLVEQLSREIATEIEKRL